MHGGQESSCRRKTSKYFQKPKDEKEMEELPAKRKTQKGTEESLNPPPSKKIRRVVDDDDDDFVLHKSDDEKVDKDTEPPIKSGGRGRGGRGAWVTPAGGRGRGGGRGGFMNFGERKDPPHKGEKV